MFEQLPQRQQLSVERFGAAWDAEILIERLPDLAAYIHEAWRIVYRRNSSRRLIHVPKNRKYVR